MFDVDRLLGGHKPPFPLLPTPNPLLCNSWVWCPCTRTETKDMESDAAIAQRGMFIPKSSTVTTHHSMHSPDPKGCQPSHRPPSNESLQSICILCRWAGIFPIWYQSNLILLQQVGKKNSTSSAFWSTLKHLGMLFQWWHSVPQEWQN